MTKAIIIGRILLVLNILIGVAVGSFFSWELSYDCGDIFIGVVIVAFLFTFINFCLLVSNRKFARSSYIFLTVLTLGMIAMPLVAIEPVDQASLCGYQFCLGEGVDNQQYIKEFKSEYTDRRSNFCENADADEIENLLVFFYTLQKPRKLNINDIKSISEGLTITALGLLALASLIQFVMFTTSICATRKPKEVEETLIV